MAKRFESHYMWRVFYGENLAREAYFSNKEDAERFAKENNGVFNRWSWEVQIEEML